MKYLKMFLDLKKVSVFLIALPYLAFNTESIIHSPFYTFSELLIFLSGLLLFDVFVKWVLLKLNDKLYTSISLFIVFIGIIFFYGLYLTNFIQKEIQSQFQYFIRGRSMIELLLALFILLLFILRRKAMNYQYLNVFLIIFSLIAIIISIANTKGITSEKIKSSFVSIPLNKSPIKPILLIISDEYASPDGLYQVYKDSSIYQFSNELISKGWIAKNCFYSYETSTIHSLSSLFNFNLSKSKKHGNEEVANIAAAELMHASIADSLEKKRVTIINFGILHIGKHQYLNRLYLYPTSFIEDIMMRTIYYTIKSNTGNFNKSGLTISYYPMETHNKQIFKHLADTLKTLTNSKTFAYIHLFMPHSPMQYMPNFPIRTENNIVNYKAFWDFTNQKLDTLLKDLIRRNEYRIILTGDHGFRYDKRINPNFTFSAFYGFNQEAIEKINSVQDLGSLINGGF
jgi:hypothetical protein